MPYSTAQKTSAARSRSAKSVRRGTQYILGVESSCDETAAAVVATNAKGENLRVLSDIIFSQMDKHAAFGGVVPEIAARAHCDVIDPVIRAALKEAKIPASKLSAIAATAGPGLIGGVMVGLMSAKAMAQGLDIPFIGVNHLEGHALSPMLTEKLGFPYLLLLISGGHCQFLRVDGLGNMQRLGSTIDDAVGECFDKVAAMLEIGFPGGPAVERLAKSGNPDRFEAQLPRPLAGREGCDMSFSGLKTAMARLISAQSPLDQTCKADLCAAFQFVIADILGEKLSRACEMVGTDCAKLVLAGGVAANQYLRERLGFAAKQKNFTLHVPPQRWCTDNAVMIALVGAKKWAKGQLSPITMSARARWPLDELTARTAPLVGAGRKGAKA